MKARYYLLVFAYCAGIFWLSSQPLRVETKLNFPGADKVVHAILYGGLAATVSLGLRRSERAVRPPLQFFAPVVFCFLYGLTDEFHQRYVPNRTCDVADLAADTLGALLIQWVLCAHLWKMSIRTILAKK